MNLGMVPDKVGRGSRASSEPWATSLEQDTQVSMATLRAATTHQHRHTDQVSGNTCQPNTSKCTSEGGKGKEKRQSKRTVQCTKQTAQPPKAGMHNTCDSRNPVCHLRAHDSLTTADQHWLDFNLA